MESFEQIRDRYNFTGKDAERIRSAYSLVEQHADRIVRHLHDRVRSMGDEKINEMLEAYPKLPEIHREWLLTLFTGPFDNDYHWRLTRIGRVHASRKMPSHFVNVSMNIVRGYLIELLSAEIEDRRRRTDLKASLNKLIDINLDVITSSYIEEEIETHSPAYKLKTGLVRAAERFSGAMNMVLVFALVLITIGVVGLFGYDVISLARGDMTKGVISALGSLLILWVLIELMNTEIEHLKGGTFNISVFIGVALVAFIRDLMIATLKHEKISVAYNLIVAIFVLGIVYWLVTRAEQQRSRKRE